MNIATFSQMTLDEAEFEHRALMSELSEEEMLKRELDRLSPTTSEEEENAEESLH